MIRFSCPGCGRKFNVPDSYSGRKAECKTCSQRILVPEPIPVSTTPEPPRARMPAAPIGKLPVRTRRLIADLRQMREAFSDGSLIRLMETTGDPAEVYKIEFNVRGIESIQSQTPLLREQHIAEIRLISDYPRLAPACRMITPIFHPNIDDSAICVGDHWVAGEHLTDLVIRIAQMIAYQAYNIKSPLNGQAAMWADLNPESFPIDARDLYPAMAGNAR
jgi:ubiquitin-protein ligase/DNA-directed RNA polymerase subunit RPC12/RpoP